MQSVLLVYAYYMRYTHTALDHAQRGLRGYLLCRRLPIPITLLHVNILICKLTLQPLSHSWLEWKLCLDHLHTYAYGALYPINLKTVCVFPVICPHMQTPFYACVLYDCFSSLLSFGLFMPVWFRSCMEFGTTSRRLAVNTSGCHWFLVGTWILCAITNSISPTDSQTGFGSCVKNLARNCFAVNS